MDSKKVSRKWQGMSEEMNTGIAEWREQHPQATFREIEAEIDRRLDKYRAKILSDTANLSASAAWKEGADGPVCPKCGARLEGKGKKKRELQVRGGRVVEIEREYGVCPKCGQGIFPLDEELELLPGGLTPRGHENLVRLSSWMPFARATELMEDMQGICVSPSMSRRNSEAAGAAYAEMQTEEVERLERDMPPAPKGAEKMQISADGAMVPLLHGQWAEVRTLVIGEVRPAVQERGEWVVHTRNLSYFSRKISSEAFERLALVEIQRRGVENARQVAAVMDGSDWLQSLTDYHRPDAVRILDFPHAGEHISQVGEFLCGEGTPQAQEWLKERLHRLKHEGPEDLFAELHQLQAHYPDAQEVSGNLAYLKKREPQIQYPRFQADGWPIGSGIVESGNKLVVEARLKGSGMHWAEQHVNSMLALRNIVCSGRWKEDWPKIETRLRQQVYRRSEQLHQSRKTPTPVGVPAVTIITSPVPQIIPLPIPKKPIKPTNPKDNPWRKFKFGRALYQRDYPPKK
ncbi:MAG: ISKra4 family transposase [Bacteroidetes bacterium]|nr:ISKra4 family transposase [Bacteroidota bacterium]